LFFVGDDARFLNGCVAYKRLGAVRRFFHWGFSSLFSWCLLG
jgi:hypothetical protein